jgi:hypothetical protein
MGRVDTSVNPRIPAQTDAEIGGGPDKLHHAAGHDPSLLLLTMVNQKNQPLGIAMSQPQQDLVLALQLHIE